MIKKVNRRAQKKALKKSIQKNNRNISGKNKKRAEKRMSENINYQLGQFIDEIADKLSKTKAKLKASLNVKIANLKFMMQMPLKKRELRQDKGFELGDLIYEFATYEHISLALAAIIICNCLPIANAKAVSNNRDNIQFEITTTEEKPKLPEKERDAISYLSDYYESKCEELLTTFEDVVEETAKPREFTIEEMFEINLDKYGVTASQFNEVIATCLEEAGKSLVEDENENYYDECRNVASSIFNRTSSISCINFVNKMMGAGTGTNIYYQVICPGQYTADRGTVIALAQTDMSIYDGYEAVIKLFFYSNPSHDYYRFVAPRLAYKYRQYNCIQLSPPRGNYYFAPVLEHDRIDLADVLPNYGKYMTEEYLGIDETSYNDASASPPENEEDTSMNAEERAKRLTLKPQQDSLTS